jgi:hypothetical protein
LITGNGAGKLQHKTLTKNGSFYGISKTPNTALVGDSNWLGAKPTGTHEYEGNSAGMNLKSNIVLASARLMGAKPKGVGKLREEVGHLKPPMGPGLAEREILKPIGQGIGSSVLSNNIYHTYNNAEPNP